MQKTEGEENCIVVSDFQREEDESKRGHFKERTHEEHIKGRAFQGGYTPFIGKLTTSMFFCSIANTVENLSD